MRALLDTDVVSEMRKPRHRIDPGVARWVADQDRRDHYLSILTCYELWMGTLRIARRDEPQAARLRAWYRSVVVDFGPRVLPLDQAVVETAAGLQVPDPRPVVDGSIAATALVHGLTVVTRNISDFEGTGVPVHNPFGTL